ncbi:MAG: hypothetical protein NDI94_02430 [Candidatus Woesearchaeota archaeon]|nr:hypothetical protein [Candidatus Woesearchaeota archaeon]
MTSNYECEVRFEIRSIEEFENRLKELDASLGFYYEFTDTYFEPLERWDPVTKNIRIRQWHQPDKGTVIYLVKNQIMTINGVNFKRSLYRDGKLTLFKGTYDECVEVLTDMGFKQWLKIEKKDSRIWHIDRYGFSTIAENINGRWYGELEFSGEDPDEAAEKIKNALEILEIKEFTYKPISKIISEKIQKSLI